jgi:O-antigen ligase
MKGRQQSVNAMQLMLSWMPALTAFVLPLHPRLSAISLLIWSLLALPYALLTTKPRVDGDSQNPLREWIGVGSVLYFVMLAVGMLWTHDMEMGWFALEVKSSMWLMPLLFYVQHTYVLGRVWVKRAIRAFVIGLALYMAYRMGFAVATPGEMTWRYDGLAGPFHPTYMAAYLLIGMLNYPSGWKGKKIFLIVAGLFMGLLASKAGWIIGGVILVWRFTAIRWMKKKWDASWVLACVFLLIGAFMGDAGRMGELLKHVPTQSPTTEIESLVEGIPEVSTSPQSGSTAGRLQAWSASWEILKGHPWGVGTGDVTDELVVVYRDSNAGYALKRRMNPHSAYWQIAVTTGWLGLLVMLLWWGGALFQAVQCNAYRMQIFVLIILLNGIFESIFELQQGVVAWTFMGLVIHALDVRED